jgi:hypothetical protein
MLLRDGNFCSSLACPARYPPPMSRNDVPMDSAEDSFARLLEHFTTHSRPQTPIADSGPEIASPTGSASSSKSISTSGSRPAMRALLPLTESTAGRASGMLDSTPLSYEKALRLHVRRTATANTPRDLPELPIPADDPRRDRATRKSAAVQAGKSFLRVQSAAQTAVAPTRLPGVPSSTTLPSVPSNTQAAAQPRTKPAAKSSFRAQSRSKSQSKRSSADQEPFNDPQGPASTAQTRKRKNPAKVERHDLQWNPIEAFDQSDQAGQLEKLAPFDQPAQRRSIVSLRLTDNEFLRLKERACESGVSVSAYMRSCIVDADQLRAQVKQALAAMRALNARPDLNRFPALPPPRSTNSDRGGDWLRLLARSAVFLLSPFFPFRRGA